MQLMEPMVTGCTMMGLPCLTCLTQTGHKKQIQHQEGAYTFKQGQKNAEGQSLLIGLLISELAHAKLISWTDFKKPIACAV